jgi:hypothetical protein
MPTVVQGMAGETPTTAPLASTPLTVEEIREDARRTIAIVLLGFLGLTLVAAFVSLWTHTILVDDLQGLATALIASVVGLVGTVAGFYFGSAGASGGAPPPPGP